MFILKSSPSAYTDPWQSTFDERLRRLGKGRRRVAYYYDYPDNSTFRYRVYNMIQVLEGSRQGASAAYFSYEEQDRLDQVVDLADVLVICRARYNHRLNQVVGRAHRLDKPVIYDVDDMVFDLAYAHLIMDTVGEDLGKASTWDYWFGYISRLNATLQLCDRAITTNPTLAGYLRDFTHKPVSVIPNFINREQLAVSDPIFQEKTSRGFERDGRVHLGYFSGTPTHYKDFELISDTLLELLRRDERIHLRLVGFIDLKPPLSRYADRIELTPLTDFLSLQHKISEVEINLVPLLENNFTNCKSELKYFEAAIVGTLTVASPIDSFKQAIRDGENGYLARSYEWIDKISTLIDSLDRYPEMAALARQDSLDRFAWTKQLDLIERTLFS